MHTSAEATAATLANGVVFMASTEGFGTVGRIYKDGKIFGADADALIASLVTGDNTSYIASISKDATTGKLTANALPFKTKVLEAIGNSSSYAQSGGITVSVVTTSGSVSEVLLDALNLDVTGISAASGSFTNLTVGGKTVGQIAGETIAASTLSGDLAADGTSLVTDGQVVEYVSAAIQSFDNAMHYIGTTSDAAIVQDATAVPSDITGYTSEKRKAGDIILKGTEEYIWNGSKWEKIGDQSAVTGGGSGVTVSGVTVSVATAAATAFPSVTVQGIGTAATKDYVATNMASDGTGLPTESAVAAYVKTFADNADAKASTGDGEDTYGGLKATVTLYSNSEPTLVFDGTNVVTAAADVSDSGKAANFVTAGAVSGYVGNVIGGLAGSSSAASKGISVEVISADGEVTTVNLGVDLDTDIGPSTGNDAATNDEIPSSLAVRNAIDSAVTNAELVWKNASGVAIDN